MPLPGRARPLAALAALALAVVGSPSASGIHAPDHPLEDQGLNANEEQVFAQALPALLGNPDVDMVITMRSAGGFVEGCPLEGLVYWIYSTRGTVCFTKQARVDGYWDFDVRVLDGENPVAEQDHTAPATLAEERAASSSEINDPEPRNLVDPEAITYPFAYERIVAEFDHPRTGDFVIVPDNTADRGNKGAHGHLGQVQSRSTFLIAGRGARRTPLSPAEEAALAIRHPDMAATVARAMGVHAYFTDTGEPARLLNGAESTTALLRRQDGRVLEELLEPVFNVIVVVVDGLRPQDVTPTLMPNLTTLLGQPCEAGGTCATSYEQARDIMVTETNGNHTAMMTGAYGETSGIFANSAFDTAGAAVIATDRPELNLAETLFDAIESQKPWLRTAAVMGKEKLRNLFDCTKDATGACGPNGGNPEGVSVNHVRPDFLVGADTSPSSPDLDCPAEPASGSGVAADNCIMDVAIRVLGRDDPDFTFINLAQVDGQSHLFGAGSPEAQSAVAQADVQLDRLVDKLKASGKWQHSVLMVTADHNFGDTINPANTIVLNTLFAGVGPSPWQVVTHGGSASVYLTDLQDGDGPLTTDQQDTLKALRERAVAANGVVEALYRLPNPADGGDAATLGAVHPDWRVDGTRRVGELLVTAAETHSFVASQPSSGNVILGEHGHPTDRHVPFHVISGGTYAIDQTVRASEPSLIDEADDTAILTEQAEVVDIAPTVAWLLGVEPPAQNQGRLLAEAFFKHPLQAHLDGDITEPIANRGAIFIYDANNSIDVHCLLDPSTCGDPVPAAANDPGFVPNLRGLAENGTLTTFGSIATWPSVTFPNHNVVGAGVYPGHHGIVNNRFYLRDEKRVEEPISPTSPDHPLFHFSVQLLDPDFETLHEAVHRTYGDWSPQDGPASTKAFTAAVNEPSARGADYATLEPQQSFPNPETYGASSNPAELAQDTTQSCAQNSDYFTESALDHFGQTQARRLFDDQAEHPIPRYLINNWTLTDGAGHVFGPHTSCTLSSYRDSDRRIGRIFSAMRSAGVMGEFLVVITGDHGMENENLDRRGLPSDFANFLNQRGFEHVMADWHVYLLTMNVAVSGDPVRPGEEATVTFTVTDDDTGDPIEGAQVTVDGLASDPAVGTTDAEGKLTLTITAGDGPVTATSTMAGFNDRVLPLIPAECPGFEDVEANHVVGTSGADTLFGTAGRDVVCGQAGDDVLRGLTGADILVGGAGADRVFGGAGADVLRGGTGPDLLAGGRGNDLLGGGRGDDTLKGGAGDDRMASGRGRDRLNGGVDHDRCAGGPNGDRYGGCEVVRE